MVQLRQNTGRMVRVWLASVLVMVGLMGPIVATVGAETGDCDNNAVIRCGAYTLADLKQKYNANQGSAQAAYQHFGIASASSLNGMVDGQITRDAQVKVDGKVVATNAMTAGRHDNPKSSQAIAGGKFYKHAAGANMVAGVDSLQAFVKLDANGKFLYAVIKSCGNPVSATPKPPKPQPAPQPQPVPAPVPAPVPEPVAQQPTPSFTLQKDVRVRGQSAWSDSVRVAAGAEIEYRILITNTGQTDLSQPILREQLPSGVTKSPNYTLNERAQPNNISQGVNLVNHLQVGKKVEIIFGGVISTSVDMCTQGVINTATVSVPNLPDKSDTATVYVCKPVPVPAAPAAAIPTSPAPVAPAPVVQAAAATPTRLVVTGPSEVMLAFVMATLGGVVLYRLQNFYRRII